MPFKRKRASGKVVWYASYRAPDGSLCQERAGTQKRDAEILERKRKREVRDGTWVPPSTAVASVTLRAYAKRWLKTREARVRSTDAEESWLRLHILPELGSMRLAHIRPKHVASLARALQEKLSAKSVRNAIGVLSSLFASAVFEEFVASNPCKQLPRGTLPASAKRKVKPFRRAEVERMLSEGTLPGPRRVLLGLCSLAGMRPGEAAGRRWKDIERREPLSMIHIHDQWGGAPLKGARDEVTAERHAPIHLVLSSILATWKLRGFAEEYGRHPTPDDFIVPSWKDGKSCLSRNQLTKRFGRDMDALGIPREGRGLHSGRRFFVTYTQADGANRDIIRAITHGTHGATDILDSYSGWGWETLCRETSRLQLDLSMGEVIALPKVAAGASSDDAFDDAHAVEPSIVVEALGIEPSAHHPVLNDSVRLRSADPIGADTGFTDQSDSVLTPMTRVIKSLRCPECAGELREWRCTDCGLLADSEVG